LKPDRGRGEKGEGWRRGGVEEGRVDMDKEGRRRGRSEEGKEWVREEDEATRLTDLDQLPLVLNDLGVDRVVQLHAVAADQSLPSVSATSKTNHRGERKNATHTTCCLTRSRISLAFSTRSATPGSKEPSGWLQYGRRNRRKSARTDRSPLPPTSARRPHRPLPTSCQTPCAAQRRVLTGRS
jgi:hypothetical protein